MAFFNFNKPADNTAGDGSTERKPIILQLNEDSVSVSFDDADGKTISELFVEFASEIGDTDRINRFIAAGQIVDANDPVVPGTVYRGAITSETKGIA